MALLWNNKKAVLGSSEPVSLGPLEAFGFVPKAWDVPGDMRAVGVVTHILE